MLLSISHILSLSLSVCDTTTNKYKYKYKQGMHEDSIRYYVRALAMNPKADNAWQYLRISLRYYIIHTYYII